MPWKGLRVFGRALKVSAVKRMVGGENVSALSRALKVRRTILYRWKNEYETKGKAAFRCNPGRPPKPLPGTERAREEVAGELAAARHRVAELERKIGQQQVELDFFRQALRQVAAERAAMSARGAKASTPSSKR